jgi:hypothetical protein
MGLAGGRLQVLQLPGYKAAIAERNTAGTQRETKILFGIGAIPLVHATLPAMEICVISAINRGVFNGCSVLRSLQRLDAGPLCNQLPGCPPEDFGLLGLC